MILMKSKKLGKMYLDMNIHYLELSKHLELLGNSPRLLLDPSIQVFPSEPQLYGENKKLGPRQPPGAAARRSSAAARPAPPPPPPSARLDVAIPDSCLADESTRLDKSRKISSIARACAVFGVHEVYVYEEGGTPSDRRLLASVLRYAETPPFLRRRLYGMDDDLRYAGALKPLKIPSHSAPADLSMAGPGDVREGVVLARRGELYADVGAAEPVAYRGRGRPGERVTLRLGRAAANGALESREIGRDEAGAYWGYRVRARGTLRSLLSSWKGRIILTSRLGRPATAADVRLHAAPGADPTLVAFGSTDRGIREILGASIRTVQNARTLNFFPGQQTETVRLEEAVLGVLSVLRSGM